MSGALRLCVPGAAVEFVIIGRNVGRHDCNVLPTGQLFSGNDEDDVRRRRIRPPWLKCSPSGPSFRLKTRADSLVMWVAMG